MAEGREQAVPTVGYHPEKGAQTFNLKPGESLPKGWSDKPHPGQHAHDAEQGREPAKDPAKA